MRYSLYYYLEVQTRDQMHADVVMGYPSERSWWSGYSSRAGQRDATSILILGNLMSLLRQSKL